MSEGGINLVYAAKLDHGSNRNNHKLRDQESSSQWFYRPIKAISPEQALEEEIYLLRQRMEHMFNQEQSLTSESVIEASSLLDSKINEYMHKVSKNR